MNKDITVKNNQKNTLIITSGEAIMPHFAEKFPMFSVVPMNEAMCEGKTAKKIFSDKFNEIRAAVHGVTEAEYKEKTSCYFIPSQLKGYEQIDLYFDYDMFCGINIITLLAYFEQIKLKTKIMFHLIDYDGNVLSTSQIILSGYRRLYHKVVFKHKYAKPIAPITERVIELYFSLASNSNPINAFIEKNLSLSDYELCVSIIKNPDFADYGLGDAQIYKIISMCKNKTL